MPSLWCSLSVPFDLIRQPKLPFCLDVWLTRTRGRPLSLALDSGLLLWKPSN
ncbi:hypothetical protein BDR05DRAFT_548132 [Suillus weaverae]|nr:hypothetical protein BDR05DRAFT_548132 [Suillus weaverae]